MKTKLKIVGIVFGIILLYDIFTILFLRYEAHTIVKNNYEADREAVAKMLDNAEEALKRAKKDETTDSFSALEIPKRCGLTLTDAETGREYANSRIDGMEGTATTEARVIKTPDGTFMLCASLLSDYSEPLSVPIVREILLFQLMILTLIGVIECVMTYTVFISPIRSLCEKIEFLNDQYDPSKHETEPPLFEFETDVFDRLSASVGSLVEAIGVEHAEQSKLIASISHDMKTPLTSIMGYSERLQKGIVSPERTSHYIDIIASKSRQINDLIKEFDRYVSERTAFDLTRTPVAASELVAMTENELREELENKGITFAATDESNGAFVYADMNAMQRVLMNLIMNSVTHGGEKVTRVELKCKTGKRTVDFFVIDDGTGVEDGRLEHIFRPFYTADLMRDTHSGLGMAIAKKIVELHDGGITAYNTAGGFCVRFSLPELKEEEI